MNRYHLLAVACVLVHVVSGMENDWKAEQYKRNSNLQYNAAMRALSAIEFKGNEKVLDIGCGDGGVTEEIAKKVPNGSVLGIDISPNMIEHARNNHIQNNLTFDLQDIAKAKYPYELMSQFGATQAFDIVTAFSSLSWVKDQQQAFTNIARLLRYNKGILRAGLAHEDSPYLRARYKMLTHNTWKQFFVDYEIPYYPSNEVKVKSLLRSAGLQPTFVCKIEVSHTLSRQDFIHWMRAIPVQIDRIPEDRQEEFLNDIVDEYLTEVSLTEDGLISLSIGALVVRAETVCDLSGM